MSLPLLMRTLVLVDYCVSRLAPLAPPPSPHYDDLIYFSHLLAGSVQIRSQWVLGLQHRHLGWGSLTTNTGTRVGL